MGMRGGFFPKVLRRFWSRITYAQNKKETKEKRPRVPMARMSVR